MQSHQEYLTTNAFAQTLGVKGGTVRRSLCTKGHYLGIKPIKLPNNRLLWPREDTARLLCKNTENE